jgi:L-galactose dehydrogenase
LQQRTLGRTGLSVSILGFGASPLGGVFGPVGQDEADGAVRAALEAGVNFFDVAPYYGQTRAETVLGRALRGVPRDRVIVATKVGRYGADDFDFSARRVAASVDESLTRLGVGHVDLLQCHDIEFGSLDRIVEETLPALERVRDQGKARFLGITGLPLAIFRRVLDRTDAVDAVLSYCHFALFDDSLRALIPYLQSKSVGVINASPLGMGLLTGRPLPDWHPAPPDLQYACTRAAAHCRARGADLATLALQWSLHGSDGHSSADAIATTLVGMASAEDVRRNVAAAEAGPLDPVLLAEVSDLLAPVHNVSWPSGRPENNA